MLITPESKRYSNDLDYFHDSEERVASAFESDRESLSFNAAPWKLHDFGLHAPPHDYYRNFHQHD